MKEGGKLLLGERGYIVQENTSAYNYKFTKIGFTVLTNDAVMCVMMFEGKRPINII